MVYKTRKLGEFIEQTDIRNTELAINNLLGVSIEKKFIPSIANTIGTDFSKYKIVKKGQFAYGPVTSRNGDKISIALLDNEKECIVSSSYTTFKVVKSDELNEEYLMMLFSSPEFDRYSRYNSWGSARETFSWEDFCNTEIDIPNIENQIEMVSKYKKIINRIEILTNINNTLMKQANLIFEQYYGDYIDVNNANVPNNWEKIKLEAVCEFINGYAFKSEELLNEGGKNTYAVFKQGNIKKGGGINHLATKSWVNKEDCKNLKKYILKKNDILMAMTDMKESLALLGHTALMDTDDTYILNQRVGLLRCNYKNDLSPYYIFLLTNNKAFIEILRQEAHYGVQVNLSKENIMNSNIILPPKEYNREFNEKVIKQFNLIDNYTKEIIVLKNLLENITNIFIYGG